MSYPYERYEQYDEQPPRSAWRRWIIALTILVWLLLLGLLLVYFVVRPRLTRVVEQRIEDRIAVVQPTATEPELGTQVPTASEAQVLTITEAGANQWVAGHRDEFQGVDDVRVRFIPGEGQADLTVGGVTSTARGGARVVNGQIEITNARIDPPLGLFVDVNRVAILLQERLNSELAALGYTVTDVAIQQGQIQITVE